MSATGFVDAMSVESLYQKGNDQLKTPDFIRLGLFQGWFDPCPFVSMPFLDGLKIDWPDRTFVNPPYSNPAPWIEKALRENHKNKTIAMLLKHDSSTKWWARLHEGGAHFLPFMGRLVFTNGKQAPFPSVLVFLYGGDVYNKTLDIE